jgi:hypothetical protein
MALLALAAACIIGYRVEEAALLAGPYSQVAELPANANTFTVTPNTLGIHWYRVVARMSDGTLVTSIAIPVTVSRSPQPPINIQLLFASL